jgi:NAD(P)-dependent dehydrogenase (short-subunit alcohol dehydrogenase family)
MRDKICMVTGATSGIGAATALGLARLGATMVICGRNADKCSQQVWKIQAKTGNKSVSFLVGDLSVQRDIRHLAEEFRQRYERLDVLVNNAGGYFHQHQLSTDGLEMTFALNHLAYFLLTHLLMENLLASVSARVINVASEDHRSGQMDFDDLMAERLYDRHKAYQRSKLANILFTYELARRIEDDGVTVNALCPGLVRTNLGANNGWLRKEVLNLISRKRISANEGADTPIYLASSPEVEGITGRYFIRRQERTSSEASYDRQVAERLWEVSKALANVRCASIYRRTVKS